MFSWYKFCVSKYYASHTSGRSLDKGYIDKPIPAYTSCFVQTSYVKYHFYTQFNRGMVLEIFLISGSHLF